MIREAFVAIGSSRSAAAISIGKSRAVFNEICEQPTSFDIEIIFESAVSEFRNHDYSWLKINTCRIATSYAPKILKLANGCYVQAASNEGIWELNNNNPYMLVWRFNPENSAPLTTYAQNKYEKKIAAARSSVIARNPTLLFSFKNAIEFSRSAIPFVAVACFTDHCDFDTSQSLRLQRKFFRSNAVRTTKGFFLNHFSKRQDNASFEKDGNELELWRTDGHELAYHSLSQSAKPDKENIDDFINFTPPYSHIPTWIDHGFQNYNFSMLDVSRIPEEEYAKILDDKKVRNLWNYIDSGTATFGVINQMNPDDFTLKRFAAGNRDLKFTARFSLLIKNIMFHYYADEKIITAYKNTAADFKKMIYDRQIGKLGSLIKNFLILAIPLLKVFIRWNRSSKETYRLAKYTPLVFNHTVNNKTFSVFQTLEMVDFRKAIHLSNIENLIREKGIFIAHTYFSVPMSYHRGRMFKNPDLIDEEVAANFKILGEKIRNGQIWNPTLNDLTLFLANFEKYVLDIDVDGNIVVLHDAGIPYRRVI